MKSIHNYQFTKMIIVKVKRDMNFLFELMLENPL